MPVAIPLPATAAKEREEEEADDHEPEDARQHGARMLPLLLRLLGRGNVLLRLRRRQAHLLDDLVRAFFDPAAIIGRVLLEVR
jgi:hypothetical protein